MNYKNKVNGEIISTECYRKLSETQMQQFEPTYQPVTHTAAFDEEEKGDFGFPTLTFLAAEILLDTTNSTDNSSFAMPSFDMPDTSTPDTSSPDFGGGDFGGSGAGSDF